MSIHLRRTSVAIQWMAFLLILFTTESAFAQWPAGLYEDGKPTLSPLVDNVTPAVVNIAVTGKVRTQRNPLLDDPFFRRFFNVPDQGPVVPRQSVGSGVIIDSRKGFVLTNHHVIENADEITVTLQDRRQFDAELIGSDEGTDVALLKIDADDLTELTIGDSSDLKVGDFVVAIGNPFGLGQTVTSGIVSALGRSGLNIEGYEDFIQTDASINPGNSGGALVDLDGRLVGINTAILAPSGGNVGIGFAIPANMVSAVMQQLLKYGEVRRGQLGIIIQDVTPDLAEALELDTVEGAVITQIQPGSPAEAAGLRAGDVVVAVDGQPVAGSSALRNRIGLLTIGEKVDITVLRDGRRRTINAEIGETENVALSGGQTVPKLAGAEFRNLDSSHPLYGEVQGVQVANVEQGSPAWRNGLRSGDIILSVNRNGVSTVDELSEALQQAGPTIALNILRGNIRLFLVIQ